ncbi:MAG: hypothetical protein COA39_011840 [Sulfurimonas sp.]|nr:hypothetical protein [Sulfurimonas sp.]
MFLVKKVDINKDKCFNCKYFLNDPEDGSCNHPLVPDFSVPKYIIFSGCGLFEKNNTLLFDEIPFTDYKEK